MTDAGLADADGAGAQALRRQVQADLVRLFLVHWRGSLVAITVATLAVALAAWDLVPHSTAALWCGVACANYLAQAGVSWQLERAPVLVDAMPRWLPWLLVSTGVSSAVWGAVPWLARAAGAPPLWLGATALFNLALLFAVVSAACTAGMKVAAALPLGVLTTTLLLPAQFYQGLACAALCGLILLYSLRVLAAIQATMVERRAADQLVEVLRRQQQRMLALEGERTLLLERQRLMRDLHDGLGSALTSSLLAVEQGGVAAPDLAAMLSDCLDDLRAVVDSLEPIDHDLVALLAAVRFRLGRRLEVAGIRLDWDMPDLPPLLWMGPSEALHVVRVVQEVLANVLRHACATVVRVSARPAGDELEVCITDDGRGFVADGSPSGRGLRFMAQRTEALQARLAVESAPGQGTTVRLRLPVVRSATNRR